METNQSRRNFLKKIGIILISISLYPIWKFFFSQKKPTDLKEAKYFIRNDDLAG